MKKREEMPNQPEPAAYPVHISWSELEMLPVLALCSDLPADSAFILVFSILGLTFSVHET